ncbi:TetR/AcrR family transcriptional regulator [soil metagenome]
MILPRNGEATQGRLMDAALDLYAQRGYAGTCLDAILTSASSSKGAFYHHFDSKEALTAQAVTVHWNYVVDLLQRAWQGKPDSDNKLTALLLELKSAYYSRSGGCPLGLLGFESRSLPPQVQEALTRGLERWTVALAAMLRELGIESRKQARDLAQQLFVVFEGGILIERMSGLSTALELGLAGWQKDVQDALEGVGESRAA